MPERRWTINGRFYAQKTTGVQRYAREIVLQLDRLIAEGHPLARDLCVDLLVPAGTSNVPHLARIGVRGARRLSGHAWEQITLAQGARGGILSLGNTSTILRRRQVVCIHDVNTVLAPGSYSPAFRGLYRILQPMLGRVARRIVTVSAFSADQIARAGVAPRHKIRIAPNGHEHALRWPQDALRPTESPIAATAPRTIIVLGSLAPHKNLATLLKIAPDLARHGLELAIVGHLDRRVFGAVGEARADEGVTWLGAVSDAALADLLVRSLCLAFPSLAEGFGLPPVEAMALGCPIVVSDRASIPEVCADAALYAPALDAEAWLERILMLRDTPGLRATMIARGHARVKQFSWRRSAEIFLSAMAEVDGFRAPDSLMEPAGRRVA